MPCQTKKCEIQHWFVKKVWNGRITELFFLGFWYKIKYCFYIVRKLSSDFFGGDVEQLHKMILEFLTILGDFCIRYPPLSNTSYKMPRHKHCLLPAALKAIKEGRKIPLLLLFLLLWPIFIVARFFFFLFFFLACRQQKPRAEKVRDGGLWKVLGIVLVVLYADLSNNVEMKK